MSKQLPEGLVTTEKSKKHFIGSYKGETIEIARDKNYSDDFYIHVFNDQGTSYDGWWDNSSDATVDEAILESLEGSLLIDNPKQEGQ